MFKLKLKTDIDRKTTKVEYKAVSHWLRNAARLIHKNMDYKPIEIYMPKLLKGLEFGVNYHGIIYRKTERIKCAG